MYNEENDWKLEHWDENTYREFLEYLKGQADSGYREFHSGLVPGKEQELILGIRMPKLREIGREVAKGNWREYLGENTHRYYEESMLHGIVLGLGRMEYEEWISRIGEFLPYVDNWAVCDCFCSGLKQVKKNQEPFWQQIDTYLSGEEPWTIRVGLVLMLDHYLLDGYVEQVLERCDRVFSSHYYVRMAQAWLVSTAYAKYPELTHEYLLRCRLDDWTYNKALQKARESYRVSAKRKELLKQMKR